MIRRLSWQFRMVRLVQKKSATPGKAPALWGFAGQWGEREAEISVEAMLLGSWALAIKRNERQEMGPI